MVEHPKTKTEESQFDFSRDRTDYFLDQALAFYCEENNINLLRIPYWEKENVESIINNHLQRLSEKGFAA